MHLQAEPLAKLLASLRQTEGRLVNKCESVAGPRNLLVGEASRPSGVTLERQLTASFLVSEARFLHCIVSNEQCLCDLTIGLAVRLNAAEVAETSGPRGNRILCCGPAR